MRRLRRPQPPIYGEGVLAALRKVGAVLDVPAGQRLAALLPGIVARLRACGELCIDDNGAARLCWMSAATIERRLAPDRAQLHINGRSGTRLGSLLRSLIPVRTWVEWNEDEPGFVECDRVGHEGGDPRGDFA